MAPLFELSNKTPKYKHAACVSVNLLDKRFDFYSMQNGNHSTVKLDSRSFRSRLFTPEFYLEFSAAVKEYSTANPFLAESSVTLILPDRLVAMDTINIPFMNRRRNEEALNVAVSGLYKNREDLQINTFAAAQNKAMATYSVAMLNEKQLKPLVKSMTEAGMAPDCITFDANTSVNAVGVLCPENKNGSYLLMDIQENHTLFSFSAKGRATGYYELPFGYSILHKNKVYDEAVLMPHETAELAVLNAKEKARAKQLTMMREENLSEDADEEERLDAMFGEDEGLSVDPTAGVQAGNIKSLPKKGPRKLPKFMQRPVPKDEEGFSYENFRIFIKWALNLLQSNEKLASQGKPEAVLVNMPKDLEFLFSMIGAEEDENGIPFKPMGYYGEAAEQLRLFGGLYALQMNRSNNFSIKV